MYILIFHVGEDYILSISESHQIQAFKDEQELMKSFEGFTRKWTGMGYESYASAGIGMMNIQPTGVEYNEPAETIEQYIIDPKPYQWSGILGSFPIVGVKVKKEIMDNHNLIDVWHKSMELAGII